MFTTPGVDVARVTPLLRRRPRPLAQPRARPAGDARRPAGGDARRGDRDAGRGPGARAGHLRRQPGAVDAERPPARRARSSSSTSWCRSTSTSTRRRATPTSSCRRRGRWPRTTSTCCSRTIAVRNVARWSPPVVARGPGERADWEILLELAERLGRRSDRHAAWSTGCIRAGAPARPALDARPRSPTCCCASGRYGDRFLPWSTGLNLRRLKAAPHGIDLGPLRARRRAARVAPRQRVHLAPRPIVGRARRRSQRARRRHAATGALLLIGRRELRTNNSWMHNVPALVVGPRALRAASSIPTTPSAPASATARWRCSRAASTAARCACR